MTLDVYCGRKTATQPINQKDKTSLPFCAIVGQGPTVLAVGAGGGCLDIFSLTYHFSLLSPPLWETARYRLKYCLKGPLSPQQPTHAVHQNRTGHKIKSKNGGISHHLSYTKLTLYLHALQKFTLSDNDFESIQKNNNKKQDTKKKNKNNGIFHPFKCIKTKKRKGFSH